MRLSVRYLSLPFIAEDNDVRLVPTSDANSCLLWTLPLAIACSRQEFRMVNFSFVVIFLKILLDFFRYVLHSKLFVVYLHIPTNKGTKIMDNKSFRQQVIDMGIGESLTISVEAVGYTTIRCYASDLGFALRRRYSTNRNRADRTYTITRLY